MPQIASPVLSDERVFRLRFLECRGLAFQDLFNEVMEHAHPGDFQRVRPHGKDGDLKCDGYLRSRRQVFQVYAPEEFRRIDRLLRKIEGDFAGARVLWDQEMSRWTFVHNSDGLPARAVQLLQRLNREYPEVEILSWGYPELRQLAFGQHRSTKRPSLEAMRRYWSWLAQGGDRTEVPPHLAMLEQANLPIRVLPDREMATWATRDDDEVRRLIRSGVVGEVANRDTDAMRCAESHMRFYHLLRSRRRVLVTGDSGSGKSTLLGLFAANQARRLLTLGPGRGRRHTPVIVDLWRFSPARPLADLICQSTSKSNAGVSPAELKVALELGYLIVLLDGIDEVAEEHRRDCLAQIEDLASAMPHLRLVLTSRNVPKPPPGFHEIAIAPLLRSDIQHASASLPRLPEHTAASPADSQKRGVRALPEAVLALCTRPLTLGLVLYTLSQGRDAPGDAYALYERCFSGLLDWEERKGRIPSAALTTAVLEAGAYHMMSNSIPQVSLAAWVDLASQPGLRRGADAARSPEAVERTLRTAASIGLLQEDVGNLEFAHRSYQEFYSARRILGSGTPVTEDPLSYNLGVLRFLCGPVKDVNSLLEPLLRDCSDVEAIAEVLATAAASGCDLGQFAEVLWAVETAAELPVNLDYSFDTDTVLAVQETVERLVRIALELRPKALSILLDSAYAVLNFEHSDQTEGLLRLVIAGLRQYEWEGTELVERVIPHWEFNPTCAEWDLDYSAEETAAFTAFYELQGAWASRNFALVAQILDELDYLARERKTPVSSAAHSEALNLFDHAPSPSIDH